MTNWLRLMSSRGSCNATISANILSPVWCNVCKSPPQTTLPKTSNPPQNVPPHFKVVKHNIKKSQLQFWLLKMSAILVLFFARCYTYLEACNTKAFKNVFTTFFIAFNRRFLTVSVLTDDFKVWFFNIFWLICLVRCRLSSFCWDAVYPAQRFCQQMMTNRDEQWMIFEYVFVSNSEYK